MLGAVVKFPKNVIVRFASHMGNLRRHGIFNCPRLPSICEGPQKDIGCLETEQGTEYRGRANRGETGDLCKPWDSPELSFVLGKIGIWIGIFSHPRNQS